MSEKTELLSADDVTGKSKQGLTSPFSPEDSSLPLAAMFPNELRLLRKRSGLTQKQLSANLNIPRNRLSLWEGGKALPSWREANRIAQFYEVGISDLYPNKAIGNLLAELG